MTDNKSTTIFTFLFEPWFFARLPICTRGRLRTKLWGFWHLKPRCGQNPATFGSRWPINGQNFRVFGTSIDLAAKTFAFLSATRFYGLISNHELLSKNFSFLLAWSLLYLFKWSILTLKTGGFGLKGDKKGDKIHISREEVTREKKVLLHSTLVGAIG